MDAIVGIAALVCSVFFLFAVFFFIHKPRFEPFRLPVIGHLHLLGPKLHRTFHYLSHRGGPLTFLRLGSEFFAVVSSPEIAQQFLTTHEIAFSAHRHSAVIETVTNGAPDYTRYQKFVNKLCINELIGAKSVNLFHPIRVMEVTNFLQILMQKGISGESFDVTMELLKVTNNVISQMLLSRCSDSEIVAEEAITVVREVMHMFDVLNVSDVTWFFKILDVKGTKKRRYDIIDHKRYDALLEKIISEREQRRRRHDGGEAKDIIDMLLDAMESTGKAEVELMRKYFKSLVLEFFTAGTDTITLTIDWTMAELINNPHVLKKAQDEIHKVVGPNRLLQESDATNLPYLRAVIKETFRLHPPIPLLSRISTTECEIDGYKIPENTILFVNNWSMGRNPKYWAGPMVYRPERFLEEENALIDIKGQHFELLPFGTGRRSCPGMMLAMQELIFIIGTMIQCFDWKLPEGSGPVDMTERSGLAAPRANPLVCRVMPRVHPAVLSGK